MKHYGDITKISGYEVPVVDIITGGSPCQDLSVAGKRAGLSGERSGLFMEQIRIIKEMREKELQSGKTVDDIRPRYMVWENVPGAFSSNKGEDFRAVLEETAKVKDPTITIPESNKWLSAGCILGEGFSIAWRVHDSQYWGVPQRRKRISLVADFNGHTAPEILFKSDSLSGNIEKGRSQEQSSSPDVEGNFGETISFQERGGKPGGGKGILIQKERLTSLRTNNNQYVLGLSRERCGAVSSVEKMPTIQAAAGESGNNQPMVCYATQACGDRKSPSQSVSEETAYSLTANPMSDRGQAVCQPILLESNQNHATVQTNGISTALPASMGMGGGYVPMITDRVGVDIYNCEFTGDKTATVTAATGGVNTSGAKIMEKIITTSHGGYMINADDSDIAHTLQATDYKDAQAVCYSLDRASFNQGRNAQYKPSIIEECSQTLVSKGPGAVCARDYKGVGSQYVSEDKCIVEPYQKTVGSLCARDYKGVTVVRRVTPLECERLQGFPDGWTDIGDWIDSKGKKHKGDADAPRYKALGNSIALPFWQWLAEGICEHIDNPTMASLFDGIGGFPLVFSRVGCKPIWASEIEDFPIAVTKIRFGEE